MAFDNLRIYRRPVNGKPVLGPPFPRQIEVLHAILKGPHTRALRRVNLCCGWGFGKTTVGIDAAQLLLQLGIDGVFLEPNVNLMETVFLSRWEDTIPEDLYSLNRGRKIITWLPTGAKMLYHHRGITASLEQTLQKLQGWTLGFYIDDEASSSCSMKVHQSLGARIRSPKAPLLTRLTLSTPRMGEYADLINERDSINIFGKSEDNPYLDRERLADMRAHMSRAQAKRDMDGELVALEDMIWHMVDLDHSWPKGSVDDFHPRFNPAMPWWLFSDLGSATGADVVVQMVEHGIERGIPRWVIVADLCPQSDASIKTRWGKLADLFGVPAGIVAGRDVNTRSLTDGATAAYFAQKLWGSVRVIPADETNASKQRYHEIATYMFDPPTEARQLTIARDLIPDEDGRAPGALDKDSKRGIVEMIKQDIWVDEDQRSEAHYLPKGRKIRVSHVRDALLNGAGKIMRPERWAGDADRRIWTP